MNNKTSIRKVSLTFGILTLITIIMVIVPFFVKFEYRSYVFLSGFLLFALIFIINWLGGYYYVELEVENNSILKLKHYNLFIINRKFKMYQIQLKRLHKIEVKNYFFGFFTFIYVYEQAKRGVSRFPKIGFSAFPRAEKKKAIEYLQKLVNFR